MSSVAENRRDPFAGVVWHHSYIDDWDDPGWDADTITAELLGSLDYRDKPDDWLEEVDGVWPFEGLSPVEIEKKILFDGGRPNWGKRSPYKKPYYKHMLALIAELFPMTDITPSLADATMLFCKGIGTGASRKILNLIGAQDMGKSAFGCRIAFAVMFIDPHFTSVYVSAVFDNAADSGAWGDIEELWDQLKEAHPVINGRGDIVPDKCKLFPDARLYRAKQLDLVPDLPKTGSIVYRGVKHVGKFKGSKTRGKDPNRGVFLVIVDEVNEIENMSFLRVLTNIASQEGFFAVTSQNFKDTEDMGGLLCEPKPTFGGPSAYEELDIDTDFFWHSAHSSITLRLDGEKSPNILSGRDIYPQLFRQKTRQRLIDDYGQQSPDYYSQARSFPVSSDEMNSVISIMQLNASRFDDMLFSILGVTGRYAFCDPAFGGRDKVVWGWAESVMARVTDADGNEFEQELLVFKERFTVLLLKKSPMFDTEWAARLKKIGISTANFDIGKPMTYEEQIAIQSAEACYNRGIPFANFGYDFSMRPDIVTAVVKTMGLATVPFDYNTPPQGGHMVQRFKQLSEECCKNRVSELAFLASDLFFSKQIRGGEYIDTACKQLQRTRYETKQGKKIVEGKKEYKDRYQQVSPDHRDVLMGICGMAFARGFRKTVLGNKAKMEDPWAKLHASQVALKKVKPSFK